MDPRRFDTLARAFAAGGTRRRLLAALAALPLVGGLADCDPEDTAAATPRQRLKRRQDARRRNHKRDKNRNKRKRKNRNGGGNGGGGQQPGACTPNGSDCQQNSDCCQGNCFGQVCTNPPNQCGGAKCPAGAVGCCSTDGCCLPPANQCNETGLCCAPNCGGKQCGPDGCGGGGTCGTCTQTQTCNLATAQCEGPVCSAASCPDGCCDGNGVCQLGTTNQHCGRGGVACDDCRPYRYCSAETGTCRDNPPCSAETCPDGCCVPQDAGPAICDTSRRGCGPEAVCCEGCCDAGGTCQPGTSGDACGVGGSACIVCDPLHDDCDGGRCQCDGANCPNGCCDDGPGNPGLCLPGCGTGGVQCKADVRESCSTDDECCSGNCFRGVCSEFVSECEGVRCASLSRGCCGEVCCNDLETCCGTGASCQQNQCVCIGNQCPGCCENGSENPGLCLANAAPHCGRGGVQCTACDGCCDTNGTCQERAPQACPNAAGQCQACPDAREQVCVADACEDCSVACPCQGQDYCAQTPFTNAACGRTSQGGRACICMVKLDGTPFCAESYHDGGVGEDGCTSDLDCQFSWASDYVCVRATGPNCPNTTPNACANPCTNPGADACIVEELSAESIVIYVQDFSQGQSIGVFDVANAQTQVERRGSRPSTVLASRIDGDAGAQVSVRFITSSGESHVCTVSF